MSPSTTTTTVPMRMSTARTLCALAILVIFLFSVAQHVGVFIHVVNDSSTATRGQRSESSNIAAFTGRKNQRAFQNINRHTFVPPTSGSIAPLHRPPTDAPRTDTTVEADVLTSPSATNNIHQEPPPVVVVDTINIMEDNYPIAPPPGTTRRDALLHPPPPRGGGGDSGDVSTFLWPLTYLCPPLVLSQSSSVSAPTRAAQRAAVHGVKLPSPHHNNITTATTTASSPASPSANITFPRIVHPFHDGNRTSTTDPSYQEAERSYRHTLDVNGSRCFAEYRGIDYNSGRANDLAQLRGVTLGFCLQMCLHRNDLVHQSHHHKQESDGGGRAKRMIEEDDPAADRLCSGVAYYNWTGICWLKKRLSGADVGGASQQFVPITDVVTNETLDFGFAGIAADFGDGSTAPSRHLIQKRVTDTNVYLLGGTQRMKLFDGVITNVEKESSLHSQQSALPNNDDFVAPPPLLVQTRNNGRRHHAGGVNLTSILYGVLSEHHYVTSRMIPVLKTWLRDEDVVVLLVESNERGVHEESERLLKPYLQGLRVTPSTVREVAYLRRNTLRDLQRPADMNPREFEALRAPVQLPLPERKRRVLITSAEQMRHDKLLRSLNVPVLQTKKAKEQLEARINAVMDRRSMIQRRQLDQGEFRLGDDSGAWKDLPGIELIYTRFKNFSYYMMIDDDAYIIQHNLRILLNSFYIRHSHPWRTSLYTGVLSVWYQPIDTSRATMTPFIQGGAGILMTNKAVSRVFPLVNRCRFACDYLPHGDVRLGCCMKKVVGISPTYETTFWHMHIYRAQGRDGRPYRSMFPVSFHRMKNESMMNALDQCVSDDIARLQADGFPLAAPVRWTSIEECYRWMRNTTDHEYKFQMEGLH
ncbi:membrane-associated protein, putative [Bodo saltans]|uniref:N-acetylgalactosaminide beta-1,3-galactosyltransferase n=1 Tax=Bodo saltans TaxID=75058 RepID=A0A0S4J9N2_BODSA|nr:membrane-associated protein, putative [Bodo saltans]|eukprot:CUG87073.1 membrane-associated protein, putative [Bodo saltans]